MAREFLHAVHAAKLDRRQHLVAILPDSKGNLPARTFAVGDNSLLINRWLEQQQLGQRNCYFHINSLKDEIVDHKAGKSDVSRAEFVQIDLDYVDLAGVSFADKATVALARKYALDEIEGFSAHPLAIVETGGGIQALWRIYGGETDLAIVEALSEKFAWVFGASPSCANIDRIFRIPGTTNFPNKKKRETDRRGVAHATLYALAEAGSDAARGYSIAELAAAAQAIDKPLLEARPKKKKTKEESRGAGAGKGDSAGFGATAPIEPDADASLPDCLGSYWRDVIVLGDDTKRPRSKPNAHYPSRSEAIYGVVCQLVRIKIADAKIAAILLHKGYHISDHVYDQAKPHDYVARQIRQAHTAVDDKFAWVHVGEKGVLSSWANAMVALRRLRYQFNHDAFAHRHRVRAHDSDENVDDHLLSALRMAVLDAFGLELKKEHLADAVLQLCLENSHHRVREYLDSLVPDKVSRIDDWLYLGFGVKRSKYTIAVGRKWLIAAVRRVRQPGCKFDTALVFEGRVQGRGKSEGLRILARRDEWFSDQDVIGKDTKVQMEETDGVWIQEGAELESFRRSDTAKAKSWLSRRQDRARMAHDRFPSTRPRQGVYAGTTNETHYLRDPTGNRRWWPIVTTKVDLKWLEDNADQLWAEAAALEATAETITLPESLWAAAAKMQEQRVGRDPWIDILAAQILPPASTETKWHSADLIENMLGMAEKPQTPETWVRLARVMNKLGFDGPKKVRKTITLMRRGIPKTSTSVLSGYVLKPRGAKRARGADDAEEDGATRPTRLTTTPKRARAKRARGADDDAPPF
jgi:hypothetical protein